MGRSTVDVVDLLRSEGFSLSPGYVAWVLRERHIPAPDNRIGMAYIWGDADVERLRAFLRRRNRGSEGGSQCGPKSTFRRGEPSTRN